MAYFDSHNIIYLVRVVLLTAVPIESLFEQKKYIRIEQHNQKQDREAPPPPPPLPPKNDLV